MLVNFQHLVLPLLAVAWLATWQIVQILHHSEIMLPVRITAIKWLNSKHAVPWFIGKVMNCPYCLSVWVGLWVGLMCLWKPTLLLCLGLAASRLANLSNDLLGDLDRTPKLGDGPIDDQTEDIHAET